MISFRCLDRATFRRARDSARGNLETLIDKVRSGDISVARSYDRHGRIAVATYGCNHSLHLVSVC